MKTNEPDKSETALRKMLKEWRTDAALPPRFQESVWQRIEHTQASTTPSMRDGIARWIGTMLPRPALAFAYVTLLLVIGGAAGWTQAHQTNARVNNELGERYVHDLDPYQASRQ
jgi:hypothetical protein